MAQATTTNPADFASRIQTYFNPKLLKSLELELVLASYGLRQAYPANGTSIRFFRPRAANTTGVQAIAEGVSPATLTEVAVGYVDIPLSQRGARAEITDLVQAVDLLNTVQLYVDTMGADAALDLDTVIRNALVTGLNDSNATYTGAYFERFAGVAPTGNSANDFASLFALGASNSKFTRARHLVNVTQLRTSRVPMIGGNYAAIIPAQIMHDIRLDTEWLNAAVYNNNEALYKRGKIMLDGCVFVEHDNPFRENVYKTNLAAGAVFNVHYLGRDAFGCPELSNKRAGASPLSPKLTILASPDKSDPHNLKTVIGWKAFYGAKAFITSVADEVPHYLSFRCKSTFA